MVKVILNKIIRNNLFNLIVLIVINIILKINVNSKRKITYLFSRNLFKKYKSQFKIHIKVFQMIMKMTHLL